MSKNYTFSDFMGQYGDSDDFHRECERHAKEHGTSFTAAWEATVKKYDAQFQKYCALHGIGGGK